ncbi:coniferyl-alcohol dehydrogenase, partial [Pseudomonas syringae pv. tagetis]
MTVNNKTLIVTGVSSGIGADLARVARVQGARVIGIDRHEKQLTVDGFFEADLGDR